MIQAIKLNKVYTDGARELHVLKDIDLDVGKSEFVVITGPSGAGKSTLLHLLGGLDMPTSGRVMFNKTDLYGIDDGPRARLRSTDIGFVFQFYYLMPEFDVLENVMMPALISRQSIVDSRQSKDKPSAIGHRLSAKQRAEQLLVKLGLGGRARHRPNQLSGGEQQRAAIARALINSPKVLFCDEPTGNLDSKTGAGVMEMLLGLNANEGVTVIMVTHEEALASEAGRVMHMKDGRIL
jgi:lipoprotein-releasing system ATP-binding protein